MERQNDGARKACARGHRHAPRPLRSALRGRDGAGTCRTGRRSLTFYAALCVLAALASLRRAARPRREPPRHERCHARRDAQDRRRRRLAAPSRARSRDLIRGQAARRAAARRRRGGDRGAVVPVPARLPPRGAAARRRPGRPRPRAGRSTCSRGSVLAELIVLTGLCVIATGPLAHAIGDVAGISGDAVVAWDIVKWPAAAGACVRRVRGAPALGVQRPARARLELRRRPVRCSRRSRGRSPITGFALYLASFGTFEDTYGTIGSGIVLLVWLTMFSMLYYVTPDLRVDGHRGARRRRGALGGHVAARERRAGRVRRETSTSLGDTVADDRHRGGVPRSGCGSRTWWCCSACA